MEGYRWPVSLGPEQRQAREGKQTESNPRKIAVRRPPVQARTLPRRGKQSAAELPSMCKSAAVQPLTRSETPKSPIWKVRTPRCLESSGTATIAYLPRLLARLAGARTCPSCGRVPSALFDLRGLAVRDGVGVKSSCRCANFRGSGVDCSDGVPSGTAWPLGLIAPLALRSGRPASVLSFAYAIRC